MNTYGRLPISFTRGQGSQLWDDQGKPYLDTFTGIAVCGLGHAHPGVTQAICDQANTLVHTSNWFGIPLQEQLAAKLVSLSGLDNVFVSNSGAEAVEAAIKLARLHGHKRDIEKPYIIVTENSFHGRTLATLTATGSRKVQAGFEPLVHGFLRVPFNDIDAIRQIVDNRNDVAAILVEPIQGEGGINIPANDYLSQIRELCDQHDMLMMLDEIQSGMGRTGKWFAFQNSDIKPDVMTLAKGLANGFPIGACLAAGEAAKLFQPGNHGSTFGGNPLACRAALATIEALEQENCLQNAAALGAEMLTNLKTRLGKLAHISDIRGNGMLLAIELDQNCAQVMTMGLNKGLALNVTAAQVVRLLPALNINAETAGKIVDGVCDIIEEFIGTLD